MTLNAQITSELADLHGETTTNHSTNTTASAIPAMEHITATGGSGAGSVAVYQQIMKMNGHGRLGRTHMEDVDRLPEAARNELDIFLRRTIKSTVPVGGSFSANNPDAVFATLSAFGLRLENRGLLADVTLLSDSANHNKPTIARLQNMCAYWYTDNSSSFDNYWRASAIETLIELARYRGLFGNDGFLKAAEESGTAAV